MPDSNEFTVGISQNEPGHVPAEPAPSWRSAPTQNARPAPVTMATHASSSARKRSHAALKSRRSSPLIALSFSGRLYVIVATWPSRSYVAASPIGTLGLVHSCASFEDTTDDHERDDGVDVPGEDVEHVVLGEVDEHEGHRDDVGDQNHPPPRARRGPEQQQEQQRVRGVLAR